MTIIKPEIVNKILNISNIINRLMGLLGFVVIVFLILYLLYPTLPFFSSGQGILNQIVSSFIFVQILFTIIFLFLGAILIIQYLNNKSDFESKRTGVLIIIAGIKGVINVIIFYVITSVVLKGFFYDLLKSYLPEI